MIFSLNKLIEIQLKSRSSVGGEMESTDTRFSSFLFWEKN